MILKSEYILMESENGYLAFTSDRDGFHGLIHLSEEAARLFEQLSQEQSFEELIQLLERDYGRSRSEAASVAGSLVTALMEKQMLKGTEQVQYEQSAEVPVEFLPYAQDMTNYADMNTGCYYNFTGCYGYDDCWTK